MLLQDSSTGLHMETDTKGSTRKQKADGVADSLVKMDSKTGGTKLTTDRGVSTEGS